jgi:KaiC/GvpD/RAD55 family RecA-like ATPase
MLAVLLERWPEEGGRHDAYLALVGGLLRHGDGVHPYWERNASSVIRVLASLTHDEDGPEVRVQETVPSTLSRLRSGATTPDGTSARVAGFGRLAEIIGPEHAEAVRRMKREIEALADHLPEPPIRRQGSSPFGVSPVAEDDTFVSGLPPEVRNPLEERESTWDRVDMEPYILGQVTMPSPTVLTRTDERGLLYPGRVNSLFGLSESGKSWIAYLACVQELAKGERVLFLDLEDSPEGVWDRLQRLGVGADDMGSFAYVRPEEPLAAMLRGRFSQSPDERTEARSARFRALLDSFDPTLAVVDGMTTLYNSHGLDTNAAADTDVISSWLRSLARNGRTTVLVIDHTGKGGDRGSSPVGAHHKIAMIQGTALQVVPVQQPMPGHLGEVDLLVYKDRPGAVRVISGPVARSNRTQLAAKAWIDSTQSGVTRIVLEPPPADPGSPGDSSGGPGQGPEQGGPEDDLIEVSDDPTALDRAHVKQERERERRQRASLVRTLREKITGAAAAEPEQTFSIADLAVIAFDLDGPLQGRVRDHPGHALLRQAIDDAIALGLLTATGSTRATRYRSPASVTRALRQGEEEE